jgi:hypothetical protein
MNIVWIVVGLALLIATRAAWAAERDAQSLGYVSDQWLADHRLSQVSDSER